MNWGFHIVRAISLEAAKFFKKKEEDWRIEKQLNQTVCGKCGTEIRSDDVFCKNCRSTEKTSRRLYNIAPTKEAREQYLFKQEEARLLAEQKYQTKLDKQEIANLKHDLLADYKKMLISKACRGCGKTYNKTWNFCSVCGSKVPEYTNDEIEAILKDKYPKVFAQNPDFFTVIENVKKDEIDAASANDMTCSEQVSGCLGCSIILFLIFGSGACVFFIIMNIAC